MPVAALAAAQAMTPPEGMDLDTLYHGDPEVNLQDFIPLAERAEEAEERIMSGMRKQKRSRKSTAAAAGGSDVEMGGEGIPGIGSEGEMSSWLTDGDDDEDYEDEGDVDADSSGLSSYDSSDLDDLLMSNNASQFLKSKARHRRRRRKKLRERKAKGLKPKKHKRPTVASGPSKKVSPEVREMLGQANNAFLKRDYETAIDDLKEAIRLGPGVPDPFLTLGLIYEEMGDAKKALEVLLVAAHLTPGDTQLWKRLAERSRDGLGNYTQAAYCFHRCWRSMQEEGTDEAKSVLWDMADCFMKIKRYGRAARYLQMLFEMHPGDLVIGRMLSKALYLQADKPATARVLEVCLGVDADGGVSHPEIGSGTAEQQPTPPRDADLMNMLCEVYIDLREYGKCRSILGKFLLPSTVSPNDQQALVTALSVQPIDLVVKLGVAEAYHHAQIGAAGRRSSGTARTTEEALALSKQEPTVAASVLAKACCGVLLMAAAQEMEDSGGNERGMISGCRSPTGLEDLHLQLADAMHDNGHTEEALELLVALAQPGKVIDPVHAKTLCGRIGNYYYALGDIENAGKYLERAVETKAINAAKLSQDDGGDATSTTVSQQQNDPTVLVQLSDIWRRLGRSADADRLLLESLSYEDLLMCRSLPRAHSTKERKTAYNALMAILDSDELDVSRDASLEVPPEVQDKRLKFASAWISLMRDCELDNQRAVRYRRSQYPQYFTTGGAGGSHPMSPTKKGSRKGGGSTPKQQHSETTPLINFGRDDPRVVTEAKAKDGMPALPRIKKEMQLLGIDDLFGDKALIDFIVRGSYVCHLVGREQEAVEIIETVLHARRKRWSSSSGGETGTSSTAAEGATQSADHAGGGGGGSDHISRLEKTSFNLAIKARMRKVVFKYLRQKAVNNAHDKDYSTLSRTLSYLSKLMFYDIAAGDEESGFSMHSDEVKGKTTMRRGTKPDQLEFIDQRAWLIRQAIKYPQVYEYTLILGHLSTLAQTHRYSVREYYRAMRLRPNDPYPALLLTASLITMSISRVTYDRQLTITKGLAVFQLYEKLRLEQQGVSEVLAKAEIAYNQGRLWHQLSVFHLADRLYRQALTIIQKATRRDEVEDEVEYVRLAAAYNLATLHVQTGNRTMAARVLVHNIVPALQG
ncbi:General transcription factor IIIC, polypeptide 3 [Perkinsus olseni]|uniref:General transcription factor IIIC, polypeptide 3 n=1 Tax=Perkinsus olseni TaxID=32597 RepID=A0A7J6MKZ5_PEROL|nr:General transcription factor IIIC, polypeptide 3 [Perkinsus olseni]